MSLIVQKFGGSSVANAERVFNVAKIVTDTYTQGSYYMVVGESIYRTSEIYPNTTGIKNVNLNDDELDSKVYDLQGRRVAEGQLTKGIYVKNGRAFIVK